MMNKIMQKLTGRQIILFVSGLVSLLIGIFLMVAGSLKIQTLQESIVITDFQNIETNGEAVQNRPQF